MIFEPILAIKHIFIFSIIFIAVIIICKYFKVKNLYLRILTFLVFLIFIFNPKIEKKSAEYYKDVVLVVSDMTQSIVETKKAEKVLSIHKALSYQLTKIDNIEQIDVKITNNNEEEIISVISALEQAFDVLD